MKATFCGGKYNGKTFEVEEILQSREMWSGRLTPDYTERRKRGAMVPRSELDNQPVVTGYVGPMWNGDSLRYETQEVYNMMSI